MVKQTYKIGEVAHLLGLESHVLRFWEMEFPQLRPERSAKGQRVYSEADIKVLRRIQYLLYDRGMTIEGARREMEDVPHIACKDFLLDIERELTQLQEYLHKA